MKSSFLIVCLSVFVFAGGCAELQYKSIKTYHSSYRDAVQASSDALKNLEIPILETISDELKTRLLARRPSGIPVTVEITRIDQNFTRVAVRTGAGIDTYVNQEVSKQIHGYIRGKLSGSAKKE